MDLANKYKGMPPRPESMEEAYRMIQDLWLDLQSCLEKLELNSSNSSLPPSQDRLSGKPKERIPRPSSARNKALRRAMRGTPAASFPNPKSITSNDISRIPVAPAAVRSSLMPTPKIATRSSTCPRSPIPSPNTNASVVPVPAASVPWWQSFQRRRHPVKWDPVSSPG